MNSVMSVPVIINLAHVAFPDFSPDSGQTANSISSFALCAGGPFFPPWKWVELGVGERFVNPESGPRDTNDAVYAFTVNGSR
jgi:hypothetical protein